MDLTISESHDLLPKLTALFRDKLELDVPSPETDLLQAGLMDSLKLVELLVQLEQDFGITISIETLEVEAVRSLTRIAEFVRSQQQIGGGTSPSV